MVAHGRAFHSVHDDPVGDLLLVEKDELFPFPDLLGRESHQLLARGDCRTEQQVRCLGTGLGREVVPEELEPGAPLLPGEHSCPLILGTLTQIPHRRLGRVVEIGGTSHEVFALPKRTDEVDHVVHVVLHLPRRMQHRMVTVGVDQDEVLVVGHDTSAAPLLEFHHDEGRLAGAGVHTAQHRVGAFARQRQLVLDQDLHLIQVGIAQVAEQHRQGRLPAAHLCGRWAVSHIDQELLLQPGHRLTGEHLPQQNLARRTQ